MLDAVRAPRSIGFTDPASAVEVCDTIRPLQRDGKLPSPLRPRPLKANDKPEHSSPMDRIVGLNSRLAYSSGNRVATQDTIKKEGLNDDRGKSEGKKTP
jgi:hypothetical protein